MRLLLLVYLLFPQICMAGLPVLESPSLYAVQTEGQKVELFLLSENLAVLRQTFTAKRSFGRDLVCLWRQTDDRFLLCLVNRQGLELRFNVGSGGNLYGQVPGGGGLPAQRVTLHRADFISPAFALVGNLAACEQGLCFTDYATGCIFPLVGEKLLEEGEFFVDALGRLLPGGELEIVRLRHLSRHFPAKSLPNRTQ